MLPRCAVKFHTEQRFICLQLLLHSALFKLSASHMQLPVGQRRTVSTQQGSHEELCYESPPHGYHDLHSLKNAGVIDQIVLPINQPASSG